MSQSLQKKKMLDVIKSEECKNVARDFMARIDTSFDWRGSLETNSVLGFDYQIFNKLDGKWWMSFMPAQEWLAVWFRPHATKSGKFRFDKLVQIFPDAENRKDAAHRSPPPHGQDRGRIAHGGNSRQGPG